MSEFMGANLKSSLGVACNKIRYVLHEMMKRTEISIGYYYNFILKVSNVLVEGKEIRVEDKLLTVNRAEEKDLQLFKGGI